MSIMDEDNNVVKFLKSELAKEEKTLLEMEAPVAAQREKVRSLRASLAAMQTGSFRSNAITDADIIDYLAKNSSPRKPLLATEIAAGMGVDTRGLSRRLPRMAKDGLIEGDTSGYWVTRR